MPLKVDDQKVPHSSRKATKGRGTYSIFDIWVSILYTSPCS